MNIGAAAASTRVEGAFPRGSALPELAGRVRLRVRVRDELVHAAAHRVDGVHPVGACLEVGGPREGAREVEVLVTCESRSTRVESFPRGRPPEGPRQILRAKVAPSGGTAEQAVRDEGSSGCSQFQPGLARPCALSKFRNRLRHLCGVCSTRVEERLFTPKVARRSGPGARRGRSSAAAALSSQPTDPRAAGP